jgi:uncharacterized membrane protein YeaQ/YmgE (transglycosylase-associated protein family)
MHILWIIIIGFAAGVIAKLVTPGDNEPKGFILTTVLGIVGAFVASYLGQAIGWYGPDQQAGFIKTANFEPEPGHRGLKIKRNQKLVLNDEGPIAAFSLNVSYSLPTPGSAHQTNATGLTFVPLKC